LRLFNKNIQFDMDKELTFKYCNWHNSQQAKAFLNLLNFYMSELMGNYPSRNKNQQEQFLKDFTPQSNRSLLTNYQIYKKK